MFKYKRIKKEIVTKPFYKKYKFRIRTKLILNFYDKYLEYALNPSMMGSEKSRSFGYSVHFTVRHYPSTEDELARRLGLHDQIEKLSQTNKGEIKVRNDSINTLVYITSKELYEQIKNFANYREFAIDECEPAFEDYDEVKSKLSVTQEIRKCLYYERHRYKITMVPGHDANLEDVISFREMATTLDNIYISPNLAEAHKRRYWQYSTLAVACDDEETASYLAMIGGDMVCSVKKAVLIDELK
jgi:uncharacterized phage-like protein YoqJ